jgi:hypothetical protein
MRFARSAGSVLSLTSPCRMRWTKRSATDELPKRNAALLDTFRSHEDHAYAPFVQVKVIRSQENTKGRGAF